jgi:hypothetical protein
MILLVKKTHNWANLPPLSEIDLADRAKDWQDALEPEIPLDYLLPSVQRARQKHDSSFPINLYEISTAYREIMTEENAEKHRQEESNRRQFPVLYCKRREFHLNSDGDVRMFNLFTETDEIMPCRECRPSDFGAWRAKQSALYGEFQPLTKLQSQFVPPYEINLCDPVEIVRKTNNLLAGEMIGKIGTPEYDHLHGYWLQMLRVLKYIIERNE